MRFKDFSNFLLKSICGANFHVFSESLITGIFVLDVSIRNVKLLKCDPYLHDNPSDGVVTSRDIKVASWESHFVVVLQDGYDLSGLISKIEENLSDAYELLQVEEKRE